MPGIKIFCFNSLLAAYLYWFKFSKSTEQLSVSLKGQVCNVLSPMNILLIGQGFSLGNSHVTIQYMEV